MIWGGKLVNRDWDYPIAKHTPYCIVPELTLEYLPYGMFSLAKVGRQRYLKGGVSDGI